MDKQGRGAYDELGYLRSTPPVDRRYESPGL